MEGITERIRNAACTADILNAREDYLRLYSEYHTMSALAYMRYSVNTADEFYSAENDYYDEAGPAVHSLIADYAAALLDSPFRAELERELSPLLFRSMEFQRKAISPVIVDDMVEENRLISEYSKLMAGMEFDFRGEKLPRPALLGYLKDSDRTTRREAMECLGTTLEKNSAELDRIFDTLVHVRDRMAKKLGYDNFIELGYCRMNRLCYGRQEVAEFRQNVLRDIVPAVSALRTENAKRMGIEDYKLYDNEVLIPGGDPRPCGKDGIFAAAREMYHAMSQETGEFIDMMLENEAFDVDSRRNKWGGGYCTEFVK